MRTFAALLFAALFSANALSAQTFTSPPPTPVRAMAEWEELQALNITWNDHNQGGQWTSILAEIVRYAREECRVIVNCENQTVVNNAKSFLSGKGVDISSNVEFAIVPNNSIWVRDYGPNSAYLNDVDSLVFVDWIYNRINRTKDNLVPVRLGQHLALPVYSTSVAPYDMVNTGGNFMSDGMGLGFSSRLVFTNNDQTMNGECGNTNDVIGSSNHDETAIDNIMIEFMGIDRYVKLKELPYDCIHHIDMHMKLLDEETLLVGQYPDGVADGPQIEANIQYILDHVQTSFGTPFKVKRIPMPPHNGKYPDQGGQYRTYVNSVKVNKTVLVPFYEQQFDTTAQRVWQEAMPGYKIVGINCNAIIGALGALHCITKEIGAADPLRIVHKPLGQVAQGPQSPSQYPIAALVQHRSGIASAQIRYRRKNETEWASAPLSPIGGPDSAAYWRGAIPAQFGYFDTLYYYIQAEANSGKKMARPMPGPEGPWRFEVVPDISSDHAPSATLQSIFPNPASGITVVPVRSSRQAQGTLTVLNNLGQTAMVLHDGIIPAGDSRYYLNAAQLPAGTYLVRLQTAQQATVQKLLVR